MAGIVESTQPGATGTSTSGAVALPPFRLKNGRRPTVGVILECLERVYQSTILAGAEEAARLHDVNLLCYAGGPPGELGELTGPRPHIFTRLGAGTCDGLIIATTTLATFSCMSDLYAGAGLFGTLPRSSIAAILPGASSLMIDNAAGMRDVVEHLILAHGRRAIAFIQGREGNAEADVRFDAYRAVLEHHRIPFDARLVVHGDFLPQAGRRAVEVLCDERCVHFDALVGANDTMALAALQALRQRGLAVPHDVAVAGFDDEAAAAADPTTPLTTVRQPIFELGVQGLVDVLGQLRGEPARDSVLPTRLVVRRSCGCGQVADDIPSPSPSTSSQGGDWRDDLAAVREQVVDAMGEAMSPGFHGSAKRPGRTAWLGKVLDAYAAGIDREVGTPFPEVLTAAMSGTRQEGEPLSRWNAALSAMRQHVGSLLEAQPDATSRPRKRRAEDLLHGGRTLVADIAERTESEHRLKYEEWMRSLRRANSDLLQRVGSLSLLEAVAESLPSLDIPGAFVVTRDARESGDNGDDDQSELAVVTGHPAATALRGTRLPANQLLPEGALSGDERSSYVVEPVGSVGEGLGHVVLAIGPREGLIYEAVRDNITAALLGMKLVQRLVEEGRLREVAEKQRLEKEIQIAAHIQTSILPKDLIVEGYDIAGGLVPALEVGGDYYDVLPTEDGCWAGIGDVAGHGLTTGLVVLMIQSVVAGVSRAHPATSPKEVLLALNATLFDNVRGRLHQDQHATLTLLRCRKDGRVIFAGAHEDLLLWRARSHAVEVIPTPGPWMGAARQIGKALVETELRLGPGDMLVGHTDGITEARNGDGVVFGFENLIRIVKAEAHAGPAQVRDAVFKEVSSFSSKREDDLTLLILQRKP